jgi:hypothetical protein
MYLVIVINAGMMEFIFKHYHQAKIKKHKTQQPSNSSFTTVRWQNLYFLSFTSGTMISASTFAFE